MEMSQFQEVKYERSLSISVSTVRFVDKPGGEHIERFLKSGQSSVLSFFQGHS
jgi:hypothetical protein